MWENGRGGAKPDREWLTWKGRLGRSSASRTEFGPSIEPDSWRWQAGRPLNRDQPQVIGRCKMKVGSADGCLRVTGQGEPGVSWG
jgi:hypothetical protein